MELMLLILGLSCFKKNTSNINRNTHRCLK